MKDRVHLYFNDADLAKLDRVRGYESRSAFVRRAVKNEIARVHDDPGPLQVQAQEDRAKDFVMTHLD